MFDLLSFTFAREIRNFVSAIFKEDSQFSRL